MTQLQQMVPNVTEQELEQEKQEYFNHGISEGYRQLSIESIPALEKALKTLGEYINNMGCQEYRIPQYIQWYEEIRDARLSPSTDIVIYNAAKSWQDLYLVIHNMKQNAKM